MIHLKYLILEILYTFFSIFSWCFIVLSFQPFFFRRFFYNINLILFQVEAVLYHRKCFVTIKSILKHYQFQLEPLRVVGGDIQYFWEGGRTLYGETSHFIGRLDNHLETMLYYLTLISLWVSIYAFPIKYIKDHMQTDMINCKKIFQLMVTVL